jgi:hypothetical protein
MLHPFLDNAGQTARTTTEPHIGGAQQTHVWRQCRQRRASPHFATPVSSRTLLIRGAGACRSLRCPVLGSGTRSKLLDLPDGPLLLRCRRDRRDCTADVAPLMASSGPGLRPPPVSSSSSTSDAPLSCLDLDMVSNCLFALRGAKSVAWTSGGQLVFTGWSCACVQDALLHHVRRFIIQTLLVHVALQITRDAGSVVLS